MPRSNCCDNCGERVAPDEQVEGMCSYCATVALRAARAENEKLRAALTEIVRTSHDGEAMHIAAAALGVPFDTTEPEERMSKEDGR